MNNMKKKVIISSIMTIVICLTLIAGSTFALFTSGNTVNVAVTAGTVDVVATIDPDIDYSSDLGVKLTESKAEFVNNVLTIQYMVPGDVVTFDIVVENNSNVSVDYTVLLKNDGVVNEGDVDLWDALVVEIVADDLEVDVDNKGALASGNFEDEGPADGGKTHTITVTLRFPGDRDDDHDNLFQGASCKIACTVEAVQGNDNR